MTSSEYAISVQGLGKKYEISHNGQRDRYTSLREAIVQGAKGVLNRSGRPTHEEFWALRDLTFDVTRGDAIGVIGRNGAGKSTFLKVLSRITEPSAGEVRVAGRVSSLLEVGTGFHPELTGRENIFLNGTILGMKRAEIKQRFDEIVAFAGVARFLDTPVKRYSSGMYTRLAFAVAAHLDSEILVVDEVLAVGDMEFQRKCLGRMQDIASEGRTVLFVSHNMAAVKSLTKRCVVLDSGKVAFVGPTDEAIAIYQSMGTASRIGAEEFTGRGRHTKIVSAKLVGPSSEAIGTYDPDQPMVLEIEVWTDGSPRMSIEAMLTDGQSLRIGMFSLSHFADQALPREEGTYKLHIPLGRIALAAGIYRFDLYTSIVNSSWDHEVPEAVEFEVAWSSPSGGSFNFLQSSGFGNIALPAVQEIKVVRVGTAPLSPDGVN